MLDCVVHKQPLRLREEESGLSRYYHEDGTRCDIMNGLATSVDDILAPLVNTLSDDPLCVIAYVCSQKTRKRVYDLLSKQSDKESVAKILTLILGYLKLLDEPVANNLLIEIGKEFGDVIYRNLDLLDAEGEYYNKFLRVNSTPTTPIFRPLLDLETLRRSPVLQAMSDKSKRTDEREKAFKRVAQQMSARPQGRKSK